MTKQRVTRKYLRLRGGIALAILLAAAVAAFCVTLSGHRSVARGAENTRVLDQLLVSLAELSLAFDELRDDPGSQKAEIARGRIRRSARPLEDSLAELTGSRALAAFSPRAQEILTQPALNPVSELQDILMLTGVLADPAANRQAATDVKAAALATDMARRMLPVFMQVKEAEARTSRAAAKTQLLYAAAAVIIGAIGVLVTARFVHLPMERFIISAQSEIEASRRKAEAASEAKSVFLATMSHEIRTPLNGVLGLAELLNDSKLDDQQRHMVRMMIISGNSLLSIINDVLDLSKAEAGKLEMEAEAFNVRAVCLEVIDLFSARAQSARISLQLHVCPEVSNWHVLGYGTAIRQIVVNLVSNALKFTENGTVEVKLEELPPAPGGARMIRIAVRDTGIGIPPEAQERIFEQFAQADATTTTRFGGTGLGLAIVKNLTQAIGGKIALQSAEGEGAEFTVEFPAGTVPAPAAVSEPEPVNASFSKKVLVVDDNRVNQMVAGKMLERLGCTVITAGNGYEAVDLAQSWMPDLVLMDVRMPDMDGLDATRAIRAREQELGLDPVPVIGLSANAMSEQRSEGLAAGMDDYLAKPVNKAALAAALTRLWPAEAGTARKGSTKCA
ncbi:response regulator [Leisingera daeponensis]|uniref:histidine kinase n=1 Tax=Leisingera daeponensis TaxID=405746 RepID=A0ABS7NE95_9RHOB|nr:ATP-binding protein [Leisingera daeponensis]MBY6057163.1 response regulator [Leisingera daeponensis]MBY6139523.1 response regulator [Leisingera daeponensis]